MGRVSLRPDGSVSSRCNVNTTPLQTGDNCYSDTDQTGGEQKMVYIPQFCYAADVLTANQVWYWVGQLGDTFRKSDDSGDYTFTAVDIHPAFLVDGLVKSGAYVSAYEGYKNTNFRGLGTTALESKAGVTPTATTAPLVPADAQTYAGNIGTGWHLITAQLYTALIPLLIIECGSLNTQAVLGNGNTGNSAALTTGATTSYGNASYGTTANSTTAMTYRGIENLYGDLATYLEGMSYYNREVYITPQSNSVAYSCGTHAGTYVDTTVAVANTVNYISAVATGVYPWAFLPTAVVGTLSNFCDSCNVSTGTRVGFNGGGYSDAGAAGIFETIGKLCTVNDAATCGYRIAYLPS
jgi:hypothetical protein